MRVQLMDEQSKQAIFPPARRIKSTQLHPHLGGKQEFFGEIFAFGPALGSQTVSAALPQLMKVFWFFFSKKNYIPSFFL